MDYEWEGHGKDCFDCGLRTALTNSQGYYQCERCNEIEHCEKSCDHGRLWRRGFWVPCDSCPAGENPKDAVSA